MTMTTDPITELRALLLQFQKSGLKDMYVRSEGWTVFMAQAGGAENPMRLAAGAHQVVETVTAPHLGLFEPICSPGDVVAAGQVIAKINVLGRKTEVTSGNAGRVAVVHFAANHLVEFGESVVDITL
jgi:acetyl-CoA carboxylase biotin carboxyl carrier protein